MSDEFIYGWGNNPRRAELKGRICVVEARGKMNTVLVRFLDNNERVTTSHRALRPHRSWWWATGPRATFAFALDASERIVECAPIGRRWLMGRTRDQARAALQQRGYKVRSLR